MELRPWNGQADGVGVYRDDRLDDLLGRLVQAGVDDLHASVAQGPRDHLALFARSVAGRCAMTTQGGWEPTMSENRRLRAGAEPLLEKRPRSAGVSAS
jgi:hypothetical protein